MPYIVAGILLALSVYVRPIGFYLAPIIAAMAFAQGVSWKTTLRNAAIFLFTTFLIMSPWMLRNYSQTGYFQFSSARAWQFYAYHMPLFEQARTGIGYHQTVHMNNLQFGTDDEIILRQFAYVQRLDAIWKAKVMEHPFQFSAFYLFRSSQLFVGSSLVTIQYNMLQLGIVKGTIAQGEGALGMLLQHHWRNAFVQTFTHIPRLVERIFWVLVYLGAAYAAYRSLRKRSPSTVWIICAFVLINAYALMIGSISGETRYRMVPEPFMLLLAAYGLYTLCPKFFGKVHRILQ